MKTKYLTDDYFNGEIGGISRRMILNELFSNRYVLETPFRRIMKKIRIAFFFIIIGLLITISSYMVATWLAWDKGYDMAIRSIYYGNKKQVEQNKKKAFSTLHEPLAVHSKKNGAQDAELP